MPGLPDGGQPAGAGDAVPTRELPETAPLGRLIARLPLGIVSLNQELEVEYLNPAARVYLGSGAPGRFLSDPFPGFSLRKFARRLFTATPPVRRVVDTGTGRLLELDGIRGGRQASALLVIQDVTARERRRRAEHEFVANAAHELRTPVAGIASAIEVLQAGAKERPPDRDLFLAHIERESERLGRLTNVLLQLARIQTGQERPSLEVVAVRPLLEEVAARLEPADGVELRLSCSDDIRVLADAELLRQAVWNVAANAAAHTREGQIELVGREREPMVEVEISDTGAGIAPRDQERIFNRFVRGERRAATGFGLGLPIAREILHALGGTIALDSRLAVGTRVRLRLPAARLVRE